MDGSTKAKVVGKGNWKRMAVSVVHASISYGQSIVGVECGIECGHLHRYRGECSAALEPTVEHLLNNWLTAVLIKLPAFSHSLSLTGATVGAFTHSISAALMMVTGHASTCNVPK